MKKSDAITNFEMNIVEAKTLLDLSSRYKDSSKKNVLLKSSVVIAIAYWERFIEELLLEGSKYISDGLRNPLELPTIVKQKIALFSNEFDRNSNPEAFSKSIWGFAGSGWTERYQQYTQALAERLNTANPKNIRDFFNFVFGIRDVFNGWNNKGDPGKELTLFNDFITKRHEIAHGSNLALKGLDKQFVESCVDLEVELANHIENTTWPNILPIVLSSATRYSLKSKYLYEIIKHALKHPNKKITIDQLKRISTTAYANYNKMAYEPWGLLRIASITDISPTDRLYQFVENKITLPENIRVLKNDIALMEPGCAMTTYSKLEERFVR